MCTDRTAQPAQALAPDHRAALTCNPGSQAHLASGAPRHGVERAGATQPLPTRRLPVSRVGSYRELPSGAVVGDGHVGEKGSQGLILLKTVRAPGKGQPLNMGPGILLRNSDFGSQPPLQHGPFQPPHGSFPLAGKPPLYPSPFSCTETRLTAFNASPPNPPSGATYCGLPDRGE